MKQKSKKIRKNAVAVSAFLKGLANRDRLSLLCELASGEKSVSALIKATGIPQTSASQHLSRLKDAGIVAFRRDHRTLYYYISHAAAGDIMDLLYKHFCKGEKK